MCQQLPVRLVVHSPHYIARVPAARCQSGAFASAALHAAGVDGCRKTQKNRLFGAVFLRKMVGVRGLEPRASCSQTVELNFF